MATWWQRAALRAASLLTPRDARDEWLREWRAELWHVPRSASTRFCLGAFHDAFWLRRNSGIRTQGAWLTTPAGCLAALTAIAAVGVALAMALPAPRTMTMASHLAVRDVLDGCLAIGLLSCVLLPATWLAMSGAPVRRAMPAVGRARRIAFLLAKLVLLQPILLCGFMVVARTAGVAPFVPLGVCACWILAYRWALLDQRRRCPECLRLLSAPVRIGAPSQTFLEWYGVESLCGRGHGLMHVAEAETSYSTRPMWLRLDGSWRGL